MLEQICPNEFAASGAEFVPAELAANGRGVHRQAPKAVPVRLTLGPQDRAGTALIAYQVAILGSTHRSGYGGADRVPLARRDAPRPGGGPLATGAGDGIRRTWITSAPRPDRDSQGYCPRGASWAYGRTRQVMKRGACTAR